MAVDLITLEPVEVLLSVEDIVRWIEEAHPTQLPEVVEAIRKRRAALGRCEHGVIDGEWCEPCRREMREARAENESRGDDIS